MARTRAQENRAIRQEALREQLAGQKHEEHVVEIINKIRKLGEELTPFQLKRLEVALNAKLALLKKYIPDLKAAEITGEAGEPLPTEIVIKHVKAGD